MAQTLARIAYGTLLKLGNDASPQQFTAVAEVKSVNGFGFTADELEATHMESPNGYKEWIAGMKQGDTMTMRLNMTVENATYMKAIWDAGLVRDFELNLPGNLPDYDFSLVPLGWHLVDLTPNSIVETEMTGRITGAITGA